LPSVPTRRSSDLAWVMAAPLATSPAFAKRPAGSRARTRRDTPERMRHNSPMPLDSLPPGVGDPALAPARDLLRRVWGHDDFRGLQGEVIAEMLAGRDALAVLPTGGGKSVCYQIPAILRPGVGLVVSPLIALMADQVEALKQQGVAAA